MTKQEYNKQLERYHKAMEWYHSKPPTEQQEKFLGNFEQILEKIKSRSIGVDIEAYAICKNERNCSNLRASNERPITFVFSTQDLLMELMKTSCRRQL